jgi:hypothetical protein
MMSGSGTTAGPTANASARLSIGPAYQQPIAPANPNPSVLQLPPAPTLSVPPLPRIEMPPNPNIDLPPPPNIDLPVPSAKLEAPVLGSVSAPGPLPVIQTAVPAMGPGIRDKTLSARQIEEVGFWAPQFLSQSFLLYLGLQSVPSTLDLTLLAAPIALQTPSVENKSLVLKIKQRCRQLAASWDSFGKMMASGRVDVPVLTNLVSHLRYVLSRIMDLQQQGVWVGWLMPAFVSGMRASLDYFVARFNETIRPEAEKLFWLRSNAESLSLIAHATSLDLSTARPAMDEMLKLSDVGLKAIEGMGKKPGLNQIAQLAADGGHAEYAQRAGQLIAAAWNGGSPAPYVGSAQVQPLLLHHLSRQNHRSSVRLAALAQSQDNEDQDESRNGGTSTHVHSVRHNFHRKPTFVHAYF